MFRLAIFTRCCVILMLIFERAFLLSRFRAPIQRTCRAGYFTKPDFLRQASPLPFRLFPPMSFATLRPAHATMSFSIIDADMTSSGRCALRVRALI